MKTTIAALVLSIGLSTTASAAGCLKGALVGGVLGHFAGHHGLLGATAGCLYGRHQANEARRAYQPQEGQPPAYNGYYNR